MSIQFTSRQKSPWQELTLSKQEKTGANVEATDTYSPQQYLPQLHQTKDMEELHLSIQKILNKMNFSDYSFMRIDSAGYHIPLTTFPAALTEKYAANNYFSKDFLVHYVAGNERPIFMSELYSVAYDTPYDVDLFRANQKIYELNQTFGYLDSYCVPLDSCRENSKAVLIVSQRNSGAKNYEPAAPIEFRARAAVHKPTLRVLCEFIDSAVARHSPQDEQYSQETEATKLTKKQLLVLSTLANNDFTMKQVAEELCVSPITVNQHVAAAKKALNAKTTIGAIKKAIKLGLIKYS
ncbi:hypothetical protein FKG94_10360 [Exilibacterium tricleocarpae]|uniref:HTH luxR-type domain-containing protein n=1 Tax=Exilibacterium tricleocarpae TaxID=2591008 RepID=A0A545TS65_9GAMM|nr:autoinducer binding domain-containing protein [Exilibacterium tricleocarpae]TQV80064.1 hypothetical protein FKG94_10360 [Exilibacterium tricleocarpae]